MLVTTPYKFGDESLAYAQQISEQLGGQFVARKSYTLRGLQRKYEQSQILVVDKQQLRYYDGEAAPLYFHPNMGYVRVKRMRDGEQDPLVRVSGCAAGDTVLDCTAGLASDSLVFAYAVGQQGRVVALESEPILAVIVREGLRTYETEHNDVNEAMRRIELVCAAHVDYLRQLPDRSVDIVYFDPMFRLPIHESAALAPLRTVANEAALSLEAIEQAKRVARKSVVLKEHKDSGEFARLGFTVQTRNQVAYGVIHL